jgi:hypothetical protein
MGGHRHRIGQGGEPIGDFMEGVITDRDEEEITLGQSDVPRERRAVRSRCR